MNCVKRVIIVCDVFHLQLNDCSRVHLLIRSLFLIICRYSFYFIFFSILQGLFDE
ncbi:unnamed protein product [Brugia timori]|uniref:Uncharacterized protein n=1 Tax=Brugia timori TaxID=42155 RepID=A0A0R3Q9F9_9BILA|nr:unnamed protein product [Brugia timori]